MALKQILKELKDLQPPTSCNADQEIYAKDWNFSDPCSNVPTFSTPHTDQYNNTLFCNCSFPSNVCHVQSIFLVGQELDGVLPPALVKLPYTKQLYEGQSFSITALAFTISNLDLSFNRLKGNILNLVDIWRLATIYLTSNLLTGLPEWIKYRDSRYIIDLSYNNFSENSVPTTCRDNFEKE